MKGIWRRIAVPDAEPEVVRDHLLKPHFALRLDCGLIGYGDHRHLLRTLGVAVDEWVILDFRHGLHRLSICIQESALAVGQCFCLCAEEYGRASILHLPDVQTLVTGYHNRCAMLVLQYQTALIVLLGKVLGTVAVDARLHPVENSVFHSVLLLSLRLGVDYGYSTIIGIVSFQLALGQQGIGLTKKYENFSISLYSPYWTQEMHLAEDVARFFFPSLTTGHEKYVWAQNLKTFCKLFHHYKPKKLTSYTYLPRNNFRFGRKCSNIFPPSFTWEKCQPPSAGLTSMNLFCKKSS